MNRKIFIIIGFVLLVLLLGFAIYWFLLKPIVAPSPEVVLPPAVAPPPIGLPPALPAPPFVALPPPLKAPPAPASVATGGVTATTPLSPGPTLAPSLSADGTSVSYYDPSDGKFYRVKPDGTLELLSDKIFFNVSTVTWAPGREKAVLEYPDGSKLLYNFAEKKQVTLPAHWEKFSFSPRGDQIAFLSMGLDEDNRWLAISKDDGSGTKAIEPLGENANKVIVSWSPNNQVIAFSRTSQEPLGFDAQEILLVGKNHENFRSLRANGIDFRSQWSPDGSRIFYSVVRSGDDFKPRLWITEGTPTTIGRNKTPLELFTWADKCAFATETSIYCGIPKELPRGAGLEREIANTIPDNIYKIDLKTGSTTLVAIPSVDTTIKQIVVTPDEKYLYFNDLQNSQLQKINLK